MSGSSTFQHAHLKKLLQNHVGTEEIQSDGRKGENITSLRLGYTES